jgi:hypothetical protein
MAIATAYIIVIAPGPRIPLPNANHDDGLFFRWSTSWLDGRWLGPWNELTTSTGPLHSVIAGLAWKAGLLVLAYKRLFYLFSCILFAFTTSRGECKHWIRILLLATLLLDPLQLGGAGLRNLREGMSIPL